MIRQATLQDHRAIFALARAQAKATYPELKEDVARMSNALREVLSNSTHFAWVAEDGEVKGALLALTNDNLWAQRKHSQIVLWHSDLPGEGLRLLLQYRKWVESQRAIRFAGLAPGAPVSPDVFRVAEAAGFKAASEARLFYN